MYTVLNYYLPFSHAGQLFRLTYANFPIIFKVLNEWTVLDLSLIWDEQIWHLYTVLLDLSTCTSDFWLGSFDSFVHNVHVFCYTLEIYVPCAIIVAPWQNITVQYKIYTCMYIS